MGTFGDTAIYNFEKNTGCPERWLQGPVSWVRIAKGNNGVYFHFHVFSRLPSLFPLCNLDGFKKGVLTGFFRAGRFCPARVARRRVQPVHVSAASRDLKGMAGDALGRPKIPLLLPIFPILRFPRIRCTRCTRLHAEGANAVLAVRLSGSVGASRVERKLTATKVEELAKEPVFEPLEGSAACLRCLYTTNWHLSWDSRNWRKNVFWSLQMASLGRFFKIRRFGRKAAA